MLCQNLLFSAVAIANNRMNILKDWDWLETNLLQTLGMT